MNHVIVVSHKYKNGMEIIYIPRDAPAALRIQIEEFLRSSRVKLFQDIESRKPLREKGYQYK
jgi:hypothetical protein